MRARASSSAYGALTCLILIAALVGCGGRAQEAVATVPATDTAVPAPSSTSRLSETPAPQDTPTLAATLVEPTLAAPAATAEATVESVAFVFPTKGSDDAPVKMIEFSDYL
jgi:hypothetical protein